MAKSPQTNYFQLSSQYQKVYDILFLVIGSLTIISNFNNANRILNLISIFGFIILLIIERNIQSFKNNAEEIRRMDFIDNSFGTKYVENSSEGYYDTNEIKHGLYKMMTNVFENSLFSSEISKKMYIQAKLKQTILVIILIGFSVFGFLKTEYIGSILQILLSRQLILKLLDLQEYNQKTNTIFNDLKKLFDSGFKNTIESIDSNLPEIIKIYMEYETNISYKKLSLNSKLYMEMNDELTERWEKIKIKYEIK